jgi:hypothetical protein
LGVLEGPHSQAEVTRYASGTNSTFWHPEH